MTGDTIVRTKLCIALALFAGAAFAETPRSGFLDDYPAMTADAQRPGAEIFVAPESSLKGYSRVAIDPVLVWYAADSAYKGVEPNELAAVTNSMRELLIENLEPRYAVVREAGPGTLQVRLAITNVVAEKKKRKLMSYTPVGFAVTTAKNMATAGPNINLGSATVEAELLDAEGKRLVVLIEPLMAGDSKKEALTWDRIGAVLDAYGKRLRARLDADNP